MSAVRVLGSVSPVETKRSIEKGMKTATIVEVEGPYDLLERANPATYCPGGMVVESSGVSSTGDGMGKLTVRCIAYDGDGATFSPVRVTFRVDMQEVTYDLEDHPYLADVRDIVMKWLATDEAERVDGTTYKYKDANGSLIPVTHEKAVKFCAAYMAGIKTFNRYYPVIEKTSVWKNPPGLNRSGISFSGGSPTFSDNVGKFDSPPIALNGFPASNFFKSKDSWSENADKTWNRTEQWTYTPDGSSGNHAWIYTQL